MTHSVLVVEQLHVCGGETEDVGAQGDKPEEDTEVLGGIVRYDSRPHVERHTQKGDGEEDAQQTEPAQTGWTLRRKVD